MPPSLGMLRPAIDDDVIDAAQESSGMYRVELMRAWNAIVAALREKGAGK